MIKCYKVVKRTPSYCEHENKLYSCIIPIGSPFCREYRTDALVDMGMVFKSLHLAKEFMGTSNEVWEAEASYLVNVNFEISRIGFWNWEKCSKQLSKFWDSDREFQLFDIMDAPEGTYIGFDIRLVRKIRGAYE